MAKKTKSTIPTLSSDELVELAKQDVKDKMMAGEILCAVCDGNFVELERVAAVNNGFVHEGCLESEEFSGELAPDVSTFFEVPQDNG